MALPYPSLMHVKNRSCRLLKGSDWIRLVFALPLNSRAPIAPGNFISDGKVQVSPYGPCPTNGGSVINDQRVGTIQLLFQSDPWATNYIGYKKTEVNPIQSVNENQGSTFLYKVL